LRTNCWDSRVTNTISSNASKVEMRFTPGTNLVSTDVLKRNLSFHVGKAMNATMPADAATPDRTAPRTLQSR
jgi:hypothetical protein